MRQVPAVVGAIMNPVHSQAATALVALLCFAGCDHAAQPAGLTPPTSLTVAPTTVTINFLGLYQGAPDPDYCGVFVFPDACDHVPRDPDGGYTLKTGTQYSIVLSFALTAGSMLYQVSNSWDSKSDRASAPFTGPSTEYFVGLVTPPSPSVSSLGQDHQITIVAEAGSVTSKLEVPIRFAQ